MSLLSIFIIYFIYTSSSLKLMKLSYSFCINKVCLLSILIKFTCSYILFNLLLFISLNALLVFNHFLHEYYINIFLLAPSHLQLFLYLKILLKFMASSMDLWSPFEVPCVYLCLELTKWSWITYHGFIPRENRVSLSGQSLTRKC